MPLDKVNHVVLCCPDGACDCGGQVVLNPEVRRHQQYEFPVIRPIVTEYQIHSGTCNRCDKNKTGALPDGVGFLVVYGTQEVMNLVE